MKLGRTDHLMANLRAGTQEAQCRSWPFVVGVSAVRVGMEKVAKQSVQ